MHPRKETAMPLTINTADGASAYGIMISVVPAIVECVNQLEATVTDLQARVSELEASTDG
jgi:hypothetical protein